MSGLIAISPLTEHELPAVLALWSGTEGVGLNESDEPRQLRAFLNRNPDLSLVARAGHNLVGAVLCGHDGRRGYLHHLAVVPAYRQQGLGRRMVDACLTTLGALGIMKCNIFLYADNELGEQFWRRCGWSKRTDLQILQRPTLTPSLPGDALRTGTNARFSPADETNLL
jgi:N-acetylglutamate synthase